MIWSWVQVATRITSSAAASMPAPWMARRPASAASSQSRWSGGAIRRSRTPIRFMIHSSVTPIRSATEAFGTVSEPGTADSDAIAALRGAGL